MTTDDDDKDKKELYENGYKSALMLNQSGHHLVFQD
jgi:hypothetical protein